MTTWFARFAMPVASRSGDPELLVDTSVAVPLLIADHQHHLATREALGARSLGLCGHAAFEAYSVLTRLPPPARQRPAAVVRMLAANFPHDRFLSSTAAAGLVTRLAPMGISGGSVYDALVAATALEHDLALATRDHRALDTYRRIGARLELLA